jgi:hypothetical protein
MTLLVTLVCDEFVMQVSDRRLSRGGKLMPGEWNKAVVWCNLASIAYTGNAFRDRRETKPIDDWVAETIGPATSVYDLFGYLIHGAEAWLKQTRAIHRQAFSIVGWAPQVDGRFVPYAGLISNFHDERGDLRLTTREFTWLRVARNYNNIPRLRTFYLARAGATMTKEEFRIGFRAIKRLFRTGADPARAADILTHLIRLIAKREPTVGADVMVTCIPKPSGAAAASLVTARTGMPNLQMPTFFYRRQDGHDSVVFGPKCVCNHMVQSIDQVTYLNASGSDVDILASVKLLPSHPIYQQDRG